MPNEEQRRAAQIRLISYDNTDYQHILKVRAADGVAYGRDLTSSTFIGEIFNVLGSKVQDITITNTSIDINLSLTSAQIKALSTVGMKYDYTITERTSFDLPFCYGEFIIEKFKHT
jgi:hypothetical protein